MEENTAPVAAGVSPDVVAVPAAIDDAVERWWTDHFPGSPVAQVTQAWNHAFAAKEDLKRRLTDVIEGGL